MTDDTQNANTEDLKTIADLIAASKVALLTTQTAAGHLHSRPLATQKAEFDGDLWFFTQDPSPKVDDILAHPSVNVSYDTGKGYLSIAGTAELVHDREKVDELWSPLVEPWFPDGKDDPSVALLLVHADSAEFWASHEPGVVTAFKVARAAVTGKQPDIGENKTVDL
ncbi:pyridoxamine 5'-phosphate oxidase family protein [Leifsonia sp. NPDC058292]|uniref:pyridoxamine 5'-phosphate oxidase family protein n=1 Tax=Leifsonia sp. NPDC058292 TaxID=3346428 RepID=UPI0036DA6EFA